MNENDIPRLEQLVDAAERIGVIGSPQLRSAEPAVISLINEISKLTHDLILVLDDYHAIQAEQIHEGLSYLLDHQPTSFLLGPHRLLPRNHSPDYGGRWDHGDDG